MFVLIMDTLGTVWVLSKVEKIVIDGAGQPTS